MWKIFINSQPWAQFCCWKMPILAPRCTVFPQPGQTSKQTVQYSTIQYSTVEYSTVTDSCTFMNCIFSSSSSSLHPMSSMTSSSTSSSQHHWNTDSPVGGCVLNSPWLSMPPRLNFHEYVLKYDIFYIFNLRQIYTFDLIWFDSTIKYSTLATLRRINTGFK